MITDQDVAFYRENGYLVVPDVLDADILARARAALDELVAKGGKGGRKAVAAAGVVTARKPVAIRYRDPANPSDTWTGRGKQPRWLVARLASGARLEDFAV